MSISSFLSEVPCLAWHSWRPWRLCLLLIVCLPGCGYTTAELYPTDYATVAVPIFQNRTFYRGMEYDLTEALIKELEQRTPYVTANAGRADTLLTGRIVNVRERQLSRTPTAGLPKEVELEIVVDFDWQDLRTGDTIVDRRGFSAVGRSVPSQPVAQRFEVGQHAAVSRLAQDIVSAMREGW